MKTEKDPSNGPDRNSGRRAKGVWSLPVWELPVKADWTTSKNKAPINEPNKIKRPVYVVFDEDASARGAGELVHHVAPKRQWNIQWCSFDRLSSLAQFVRAAHEAAETDLLVIAVRGESALPSVVKDWLDLWAHLRFPSAETASLVALVTDPSAAPRWDSPLRADLESLAAGARLAFFFHHATAAGAFVPLHSSTPLPSPSSRSQNSKS